MEEQAGGDGSCEPDPDLCRILGVSDHRRSFSPTKNEGEERMNSRLYIYNAVPYK
jgi:hypothetical protein